jgi:hypothetical protein
MDALTARARTTEAAGSTGHNGAAKTPATRAVRGNRPRARLDPLGLAVVVLAALGLGAGCDSTSSPRAPSAAAPTSQHAHPPPRPLTDICQRAPCPDGQEFETFDQAGAPIFSVGEYGGASVFGDNLRVWAPGTSLLAGTAAVTLSWESPGEYDRQFKLANGCTPPAIWESPQAIWTCTSSHAWKIALRF